MRAGSVVVRPPGTGVAHAFRGGDGGMTLLMYGTRDPSEVCYYPRSGKVYFVGLGLDHAASASSSTTGTARTDERDA